MNMKKILSVVLTTVFGGTLLAAGEPPIRFGDPETLATPLREISVQHNVFGTEEGEAVAYFTVAGDPALFHAVALEDYRLKGVYPLPNASRAWTHTVAPDGTVYIGGVGSGGGSAHLYRYDPDDQAVEDLGVPIAGHKFIWGLTTDETGVVYGGTWEGSHVFRFDPETGDFHDYGALDPNEDRVRSVAWNDGYIYAGTGTVNGRVWKLDPVTGEKERIEIPRRPEYEEYYDQMTTVYDIQVVGDVLFLFFSLDERYMLAYDLKEQEWWDEVYDDVRGGLIGVASPDEEMFYVFTRSKIRAIDMDSHEIRSVGSAGGTFRGAAWVSLSNLEIDKEVLVTTNFNGSISFIDPTTDWRETWPSLAESQANSIQALKMGPDDQLYVSGYMGTRAAKVNPRTGESRTFGMGQAEGIAALGDTLYWGVYPHAEIMSLETSGKLAPTHAFSIGHHQDRPFAMTSGGGKLFVGTIPGYGRLGGALAVFDPEVEDGLRVYSDIVTDQSIVGLAYDEGYLYGSTSIHGGLGATPAEESAKVFIWDVKKEEMLLERELEIADSGVHGMISGISLGPDGLIWGGVNGTVFALDPETLEVVRYRVIYPDVTNFGRWRPIHFRWGNDGLLYCNPGDRITVVDPDTLEYRSAGVSSGLMTVGPQGDLYYVKGPEIIRLPVIREK